MIGSGSRKMIWTWFAVLLLIPGAQAYCQMSSEQCESLWIGHSTHLPTPGQLRVTGVMSGLSPAPAARTVQLRT